MRTKTCPYCHRQFSPLFYGLHVALHTRRLPDGQQKDHLTLPPQARYEGSLQGVPRVYWHPKCDKQTGMPEEIVRSYLANPFLYNGFTFCTGCGNYVPEGELFWVETEENLSTYMKRLQEQKRS